MATTISKEDAHIKGQQAGRRLSGNQQRELTRLQTEHPERVEAAEENMKKQEQRRDKAGATPQVSKAKSPATRKNVPRV